MRSVYLLTLVLLVQVACSGGGASDAPEATSPTPATGAATVGLTVQWPAALAAAGSVHTSAITLPSQVVSLQMTIQVITPDVPADVTEVSVDRDNGTLINGEPDESGGSGITVSVPVGVSVRIFITGSAVLTGQRMVSFSGSIDGPVDGTFTSDPDQHQTITLFEGGGNGRVPAIGTVDPTTPPGLHVGDPPVLLTVSAAFTDGFPVDQPHASYSSDNEDVATVDDTGQVTIVGRGSAIITITVASGTGEDVSSTVTVTVENSAPVLETVGDQSDDDGASVSLTLMASDADDDPLSFSADGLPTGLGIDADTGAMTGTIDPAAARSNPVTVTVSDGMDTATQDFTWTVVDITDPVVTAPAPTTVAAADGSGTAGSDPAILAFLDGASATDNVDVVSLTNDAPAIFPLGDTVVTFTALDAAGNSGTAQATLTVTDQTAPVVTGPSPTTVAAVDASGTPATDVGIQAFLGGASATDNVGVASLANDAPATFPLGGTVVTFTALDAAGNSGTAQSTLTVTDQTAPVVTAPSPTTVAAIDGSGTPATDAAIVAFLAGASATDNVDGALVPTNDAPVTFPLGATVVTFSATDGAGNTGTAQATLTVADQTAPVVTPPVDVTMEATAALTPVAIGTGTATDNVDGALTATPDDPGPYAVGVHTVTWSATDASGNTGTATQTVTVTDTTAPVVTAPADQTVEATAALTPVAIGAGTANDVVDGALVPTPDDPGPYAVGAHVVTWSATDTAGNVGTATQTVTVEDTTAPTVTAPADITVEATELPMPVALGAGTATDLVDGALVPTPDNSGPFALGATTVTWSATDSHGNVGTATQSVTVQDTSAPTFTLIFPLGGIVGSTTSVTVAATDLSGVAAVTINPGAVAATQDPTDPDLWTATGVAIGSLGTVIGVSVEDNVGNVVSADVATVDNGNVLANVQAAPDLGAPVDLVDAEGDLLILDAGSALGTIAAEQGVVRLDPTSGVRTAVSVTGDGLGSDFVAPVAVDVDPVTAAAYVADGDATAQYIVAVDTTTGTRTQISGDTIPPSATPIGGGTPFGALNDMAVENSGSLVVIDFNGAFTTPIRRVDTATGERFDPSVDPLLSLATCCGERVDVDDAGGIFYLDGESTALFELLAGGAQDVTGTGTTLSGAVDLVVAALDEVLVMNDGGGSPNLLRVDLAAGTNDIISGFGAAGTVGNGPLFYTARAVAVDSRGRIYVLGSPDSVFPGSDGCWGVWQVNGTDDPATGLPTGDRSWISGTTVGCGSL
jgi:hypothetical protein